MKINIYGTILGNSGYDSHTRSLSSALHKVADCKLYSPLHPNWMSQVNDAELEMITKPDRKEDWNIIVTLPNMWKQFLGLGKNACYVVWEGDKVPVGWIEEFMNPRVDMILVPSQHTADAIKKTFGDVYYQELKDYDIYERGDGLSLSKKIKIIPHGVDRSVFYSQRKKDIGDGSNVTISGDTKQLQGKNKKVEQMPVGMDNHADSFQFICNKGWRGTSWDRGGVQYLIKAFAEEFGKDEKVQLIVKLNPTYIDANIIKQSVDNLKLPDDRAPIHVCSDILSPEKLNDLYNSADCFVCATRCEAFNLPGLEAMSCGLPTIQTAFGGQVDYMNDGNSLFIGYTLSPSEELPMYEGISWAVPGIKSIRYYLRWAFENQDKIKEMGKQAEEDSKLWTWDISATKLLEYISTI